MSAKGKRKIWYKPELVVVVRSRPEENVLSPCKAEGLTKPGFLQSRCVDIGLNWCRDESTS